MNVVRPGPDATPDELAEWKRMHAELGQETAVKLRRIMNRTALPEPSPEPPDPKDDGPILQ